MIRAYQSTSRWNSTFIAEIERSKDRSLQRVQGRRVLTWAIVLSSLHRIDERKQKCKVCVITNVSHVRSSSNSLSHAVTSRDKEWFIRWSKTDNFFIVNMHSNMSFFNDIRFIRKAMKKVMKSHESKIILNLEMRKWSFKFHISFYLFDHAGKFSRTFE